MEVLALGAPGRRADRFARFRRRPPWGGATIRIVIDWRASTLLGKHRDGAEAAEQLRPYGRRFAPPLGKGQRHGWIRSEAPPALPADQLRAIRDGTMMLRLEMRAARNIAF